MPEGSDHDEASYAGGHPHGGQEPETASPLRYPAQPEYPQGQPGYQPQPGYQGPQPGYQGQQPWHQPQPGYPAPPQPDYQTQAWYRYKPGYFPGQEQNPGQPQPGYQAQAPPGTYQPQGGYLGVPGYPAPATPGAPPRPRPAASGKRGRGWLVWVAAGVVMVLASGGIAAGFLLTGGSPGGSGGSAALPKALTFSGSASSVAGRASADGLSWDKLGGPWTPVPSSLIAQGDFASGQQVITDKFTQNGKPADWTADVLAGRPGSDAGVTYSGPRQLQQYAVGVVRNVILAKEYPSGTSAPGIVSQSITVGGRPGWVIGFSPHFSVTGVKATHDTDVVVVVDTGKAATPSLFFMSIPSDAAQFLPDITAELRSLQIGS